jgi:RNA polymerase sigma factor (sigma-70 family)
MFNPFAEITDSDSTDTDLVDRAKSGDRAALEKLVLRHQAWIFNIAIRMVFHPQDAEEVTQEVLIKVITKLSTFKGESQFRTWLYRIAANHVLNMKRRGAETKVTTFADYGAAIKRTADLDLPDRKSVPVELPILVEEAKNGCTMGMLLCLDRKQRLIFTLGEILGASDAVGAEVLEMTADNFRQCLARARRDLHSFMNNQCGLVNKSNPCYFAADKTGAEAVCQCFTEAAVVKDEGHTHQGRAAIKQWKTDASTKYQYTSEPFAYEQKAEKFIVTSRLTGNFPGSPVDLRFIFELEGAKIASLEILP